MWVCAIACYLNRFGPVYNGIKYLRLFAFPFLLVIPATANSSWSLSNSMLEAKLLVPGLPSSYNNMANSPNLENLVDNTCVDELVACPWCQCGPGGNYCSTIHLVLVNAASHWHHSLAIERCGRGKSGYFSLLLYYKSGLYCNEKCMYVRMYMYVYTCLEAYNIIPIHWVFLVAASWM